MEQFRYHWIVCFLQFGSVHIFNLPDLTVFMEVSSWIIVLVSIWLIRFFPVFRDNMVFIVSWKIISVFKFIRQDNLLMFLSFLLCLWLFFCSHLLMFCIFIFFPFWFKLPNCLVIWAFLTSPVLEFFIINYCFSKSVLFCFYLYSFLSSALIFIFTWDYLIYFYYYLLVLTVKHCEHSFDLMDFQTCYPIRFFCNC